LKALVTGATGFVGSHVAELLHKRGYEVRCTVRKTSNLRWLENKPFELVEVSFSDPESLRQAVLGVDYIFHVGGSIAAKNLDAFIKSNRDGTKNLLGAVLKYNPDVKRFLYVSSQTVAGPSDSLEKPINEDKPGKPLTSYGKSKKAAEEEVLKLKDKLPVTIVRPSAVYGPRDEGIYPMFKLAKQGLGTLVGFNPQYLTLIHSDDLARGIIDAAESQKTIGQTYFLSSEEAYSWDKVYDAMKKGLNKKNILLIKLPHFLVLGIAGISEFFGKFSKKPPIFNYDKGIDFIQTYWTCSVEKAKRDFGFRQQVSIEDGVKNTLDWYIENKWI